MLGTGRKWTGFRHWSFVDALMYLSTNLTPTPPCLVHEKAEDLSSLIRWTNRKGQGEHEIERGRVKWRVERGGLVGRGGEGDARWTRSSFSVAVIPRLRPSPLLFPLYPSPFPPFLPLFPTLSRTPLMDPICLPRRVLDTPHPMTRSRLMMMKRTS